MYRWIWPLHKNGVHIVKFTTAEDFHSYITASPRYSLSPPQRTAGSTTHTAVEVMVVEQGADALQIDAVHQPRDIEVRAVKRFSKESLGSGEDEDTLPGGVGRRLDDALRGEVPALDAPVHHHWAL